MALEPPFRVKARRRFALMRHRLKVEHAARVLKNYDAAIRCRLETTRYESQTQCDAMFVGE